MAALIGLLVICASSRPIDAAELVSAPADASTLHFARDIAPIFTKAGCNGGGCHGKSDGRGGFQLSLFGFEPDLDYDWIVKSTRGRRLSLASPDNSLLLLKPTMAVSHGGGKRLEVGSPEYQLLRRWIAQGAPKGPANSPRLARLEVSPARQVLAHGAKQQLRVTAHYTDGARRDVSRLVDFRSNDTAVADVDQQGLLTVGDRPGETSVMCLYQGQAAVATITVPLANPKAAWPRLPVSNLVDEHVFAKLRELRIAPSDVADDATFLRRASLQIAGQLPKPDEVRTFLADSDPHKRAAAVERLVASGAYADHFAQKWSDVLRNKRRNQNERLPGTIAFHRWIRNALAEDMPYDQFVRSILTACGNSIVNPPAQWYAEVRALDAYVDDTAQVFLGLRIGCARCHHHPVENISQDDYYGLAAFFNRVGRKGGKGVAERRVDEFIYVQAKGEVKHPLTQAVVRPHGLGAAPIEIEPYDDPRIALVDWMARSDNPYFARAFVNRMWAHFFSRGLVDPLDDLRPTNPASNEPLLAALADEFVRSGYNMRHVVRLIACSTTYQLSSLPNEDNLDETQAFSRFYPQRLAAEVLLDAVDTATGSPTQYNGFPTATRAVQLPDEDSSNSFLKMFGRPPRESACECERQAKPSLSQSLYLMNDSFFLGKLANSKGLADKLGVDKRELQTRIEDLFLAVLARMPDAQERERAAEYLTKEGANPTAFRDLMWVLLNTKEFLYVH